MGRDESRVHRVFPMWKDQQWVKVHWHGSLTMRPTETFPRLSRDQILAIDTESLTKRGHLKTLLTTIQYHDKAEAHETPNGRGMIDILFSSLIDRYGVPLPSEADLRPKDPKVREARKGHADGRDGKAVSLPVTLAVFFNMPYDIGRLFADMPLMLRSFGAAGSMSFRAKLSDRFDLEVIRMILSKSASFEWLIRDHKNRKCVRLLGLDLTGYWKTSLRNAAIATGVKAKIDIEDSIPGVYERPWERFTPREWELFKEYGLGDVETTLELYHATADLLVELDARVIRASGVIPPSAPSAATRIVFAKAFDIHDIHEWHRYPAWADALGSRAYYGARAFSNHPGVYSGMTSRDLKSAYPYAMSLLPDPVTVQMKHVKAGAFDVNRFLGQYGVLVCDGESLHDTIPAVRTHDVNRLRYIYGHFKKQALTIPEIVIGVVSGVLKISRIHEGVVMVGSSSTSFFRRAITDFYAVKENPNNAKALQAMAKLFANSSYGKLVEVQMTDFLVCEAMPMPFFDNHEPIATSIAKIYAEGHARSDGLYWGAVPTRTKEIFDDLFSTREKNADASSFAVYAYVEALSLMHEPVRANVSPLSVTRYVSGFKGYNAGHHFFPLYAAQITGVTSAKLGLMARCVGALQGDTDSVHFFDGNGGEDAYYRLMIESGYPSPRKVGGKWHDVIVESPTLGSWETDMPTSTSSVLVRPKVYSHGYHDEKKDRTDYKQAKHGFARYTTKHAAELRKNIALPRAEREDLASLHVRESLHNDLKSLLETGTVSYESRSAPRRLREAIRTGKQVGEFSARTMSMLLTPDPNTHIDKNGVVRWKPL